MTGTPIVNSSKEVGAMLAFLKTCAPLNDPKEWSRCVERKIKRGNGAQVLKAVVRSTTLRRTKEQKDSAGNPLVKLPGVKFYQIECDLDEGARELYDEIQQAVQDRVRLIVKENQQGRSYSESASSLQLPYFRSSRAVR